MKRYFATFSVLFIGLTCFAGFASAVFGQGMHRIHTSGMPLGEIGQTRLAQGGPVRSYYQPVRLHGPEGTQVSFAIESRFLQPKPIPAQAALLIGDIYRLRVTGIPLHAGEEIYPTIELVDRLYPPRGKELEHPIVIEITMDDIETALSGKFIEKVIYLENPQKSLPTRSEPASPPNIDVSHGSDPLVIAGTMGRPVAIVRIGGRTPTSSGAVDASFFHGCPPWIGVERDQAGEIVLTHYFNRQPFNGQAGYSQPYFSHPIQGPSGMDAAGLPQGMPPRLTQQPGAGVLR